MSHTTIILSSSLLEVFDPTIVEYAGVRDHFSVDDLEKLDELRLRATPASYSFGERLFICWAIDRVIMKAENP